MVADRKPLHHSDSILDSITLIRENLVAWRASVPIVVKWTLGVGTVFIRQPSPGRPGIKDQAHRLEMSSYVKSAKILIIIKVF